MKTVVTVPTYNEAENIEELISKLLLQSTDLYVLVIDDNSPDGTSRIVEKISKTNDRVILLTRTGIRGRGIAGIEGFISAIKLKPDYIIEMDADFSHNPDYIPVMLKYAKDADIVIGSRFVKGGRETGRHFFRTLTSILANAYIRLMLGFSIKDCSSGFRCFKRSLLEKIEFDKFESKGPSIVSELLFYCIVYHKAKVKEIPIVFENRIKGNSKLDLKILVHNIFFIMKLFIYKLEYKLKLRRIK